MIIPLPVSYEWRCISWSLPKWNRGVCRLVGYVSKGGSLSFHLELSEYMAAICANELGVINQELKRLSTLFQYCPVWAIGAK